MESVITNNCHFSMQGRVETKICRPKGKDKGGTTAIPLEGNWMQTRSNRSKKNDPGKKEGLPIWRNRERKAKD